MFLDINILINSTLYFPKLIYVDKKLYQQDFLKIIMDIEEN